MGSLNKSYLDHPNKSAPPKSSSYSTLGSSFLTSFLGYYFLAGTGAVLAGWDDPLDEDDDTLVNPDLINYNKMKCIRLQVFFLSMSQ